MRVLTQGEIARMTRPELAATLHAIATRLPELPEGSAALRGAHINLQNIRRALAPKPGFGPR